MFSFCSSFAGEKIPGEHLGDSRDRGRGGGSQGVIGEKGGGGRGIF